MVWSGRIIYKSQCSGTVATVSSALWEQKVKGSDIYLVPVLVLCFGGFWLHFADFQQKWL